MLDEPKRALILVLVHGTFAPKSAWTLPHSEFALRCRAFVGYSHQVRFVRFRWSGKNKSEDRKAASENLAKTGAWLKKRYPDSGIYFIGHSHGGNIALMAASHKSVKDKITGIVSFNTPYIQLMMRNAEWPIRVLTTALLIYFTFAYVGASYLQTDKSLNRLFDLLPETGLAVASLVVFALKERAIRWFQLQRDMIIRASRSEKLLKTRVLSIWNSGDEVLDLSILMEFAVSLTNILLHPVALIAVLLGCSYLFGWGHFASVAWECADYEMHESIEVCKNWEFALTEKGAFIRNALSASSYTLAGFFIYVATVLAASCIASSRMRYFGYSLRSLLRFLFVRPTFTVVPNSATSSDFLEVALKQKALAHSAAYGDQAVVRYMCRWIKRGEDVVIHERSVPTVSNRSRKR
jgi:pimeloyl-ACP methyl ester carboxylesterase